MTEPQIKDIKSISKLLQDQKNFSTFRKAFPILRPILKLFKVDVTKIEEAFDKFKEIEQQILELADIPDKFNDIFSKHGWIIYEMLNLEVAKQAIHLAENTSIEVAELELTNHYTPECVRWKLHTMYGVKTFWPRMDLANKALTDYTEERYHACVPIVLALLDGMVNEIHGKKKGLPRGFSSDKSDLEAWDSIAAHSTGLNVLKGIFNAGRYSTVTDQITIPYRNGILHGMDLGYDNKIVAAKTWAALFAAREWAQKAEQELLDEQPDKPQITWKELFRDLNELNHVKKYQKEWIPRKCIPEDLVVCETNEFPEHTPEYAFAQFLLLWKKKNYGRMGQLLSQYLNGNELKTFPAKLRSIYNDKHFIEFSVCKIVESAPSITLIEGILKYQENGNPNAIKTTIRIIAETPDREMALRITAETVWRVMDMNVIRHQEEMISMQGGAE